jgi:hypothetical protein
MRSLSIALILVPSLAAAQPEPAEPPPPEEAPAPEPGPTEPAPTPPPELDPVVEPPREDKKASKPPIDVTYDGGIRFATQDDYFGLKLAFRNQIRFESNRPLEDETETRHNQFLSRFYIPRSRLQAEGHLFGKGNRFKVEAGLGDQGSFGFLKDAWLEKQIVDGPIYVRMGQWKRPFSRAELTSDFASTFNERSIQNELAGGGRSQGIAIHNGYEAGPEGIEWVAGVFNTFAGSGDRPSITTACTQNPLTLAITCVNSRPTTTPADFGPTFIVHVGYNSPKMKAYSESDLEGGPLRYSIGASYKIDLANFADGTRDSWAQNTSHGVELAGMIKAFGFSTHAGIAMVKVKDADPEVGLFVQPAYFLKPKQLEVAGRFAMNTLPDQNQIELRAAFNWYWEGHTWKLASDAGYVALTGDAPVQDKDFQLRVMMQLPI